MTQRRRNGGKVIVLAARADAGTIVPVFGTILLTSPVYTPAF